MPLPERVIQPTSVSRGTLQFNVPDVLEGCTNGTLANIIRQLSSLSRHAEEMFGNLFKEAEAVAGRSSNLQARIDRLAIRVTQLDSTVEEGLFFDNYWILHSGLFNAKFQPFFEVKFSHETNF